MIYIYSMGSLWSGDQWGSTRSGKGHVVCYPQGMCHVGAPTGQSLAFEIRAGAVSSAAVWGRLQSRDCSFAFPFRCLLLPRRAAAPLPLDQVRSIVDCTPHPRPWRLTSCPTTRCSARGELRRTGRAWRSWASRRWARVTRAGARNGHRAPRRAIVAAWLHHERCKTSRERPQPHRGPSPHRPVGRPSRTSARRSRRSRPRPAGRAAPSSRSRGR